MRLYRDSLMVSAHLDLTPSLERILIHLFLRSGKAGEIVIASSKMSLGQSAFGEQWQSTGPFGVDSRHSSFLGGTAFLLCTCHCKHNRLGGLRNNSGRLCFFVYSSSDHHNALPVIEAQEHYAQSVSW